MGGAGVRNGGWGAGVRGSTVRSPVAAVVGVHSFITGGRRRSQRRRRRRSVGATLARSDVVITSRRSLARPLRPYTTRSTFGAASRNAVLAEMVRTCRTSH